MSQASFASICITSYCKVNFPDDWRGMTKTIGPDWAPRFEGFSGSGSHKYVTQLNEINARIGAKEGAGVYGYARYTDGSSLLFTCDEGIWVIDERGLTQKG